MATEECAICGESVPFATTTHVLVNPKHVEGVADHYVCRPCYDEHLEGLFATLESDAVDDGGEGADDLAVNVVEDRERTSEPTPVPGEDGEALGEDGETLGDEDVDATLDTRRPDGQSR